MISTPSTPPDFNSLADVVELPDAVIDAAVQCCHTIPDSDAQWDCYLRSLALRGVITWLEKGSSSYDIQFEEPAMPDMSTALHINALRVGVVPTGSVPPELALIPRSTLTGTTPIHLWVLVEVLEELGQIRIVQGLEYQQVMAAAGIETAEGNYAVPLTAFTLPPDRVLFYLSHWQPASTPAANASTVPLGTRVMNVGRWLQDQLDEVAQQLSWTLLDPLTPAVAMRSPLQELEFIVAELEPQGVTIPPRARAGYTEIQVAAVPLRLYTLVWSVFEGETPEWSLLVFLGPAPGEMLPPGLTLRIRDASTTLAEQTFSDRTEATYLYAQVFGTWEEIFFLDILPPDGSAPLTLPAFGFQP